MVPVACALALAASALPGCKPAVRPAAPTAVDDIDLPPALASRPAAEEPVAPATAPAPREPAPAPREITRRGTIERAALDAVLDRGPGVFLGGFELAPHFREQRFAGWSIVRFLDSGTYFGSIDLRPGDVVMTVNGHTVARPRNLQELWLDLRMAESIVVRAERDGQPFELRFDVIDAAGPSAP
jgi:type II secretory pathway component PulC